MVSAKGGLNLPSSPSSPPSPSFSLLVVFLKSWGLICCWFPAFSTQQCNWDHAVNRCKWLLKTLFFFFLTEHNPFTCTIQIERSDTTPNIPMWLSSGLLFTGSTVFNPETNSHSWFCKISHRLLVALAKIFIHFLRGLKRWAAPLPSTHHLPAVNHCTAPNRVAFHQGAGNVMRHLWVGYV